MLYAYLLVILAGFLPTDVFRFAAVLFSRRLDEDSEVLVLVRAVATALLAGVIARLVLFPTGDLANVPLYLRVGAIAAGVIGYFAIRKSVLAGVIVAEIVIIAGGAFVR
ncbi:MAG: AzlD domain-containing protein [Xanthobacteraceae bacterium]|nr:AzlD domain-containing protein [Xanthobacteraceae bacterium]QYK46644.1 MAG: AzlD domain-containing protein [Xanthobacteraceae bacterium]